MWRSRAPLYPSRVWTIEVGPPAAGHTPPTVAISLSTGKHARGPRRLFFGFAAATARRSPLRTGVACTLGMTSACAVLLGEIPHFRRHTGRDLNDVMVRSVCMGAVPIVCVAASIAVVPASITVAGCAGAALFMVPVTGIVQTAIRTVTIKTTAHGAESTWLQCLAQTLFLAP
ncbi:hypothetical protein psal_cds_711 [Pandoravirus salinus]|uniref:Uncharacterized protein n=1 Tax=Pandoravirus salinus TaxID=1349410 RepID=S4VWD6_9VIRU|nr:hypothetical protein psal_cds_711 [Pandoravirus salinus]AGO84673.1 hypothetical protein psal_cds_711 [Pandoravirus salinus]